jgi:hypothetical protein
MRLSLIRAKPTDLKYRRLDYEKKRDHHHKKVPRTVLLGVSWFGKIELR